MMEQTAIKIGRPMDDIVGKKYNMLTVLKFDSIKNEQAMWLCKCDCGNEKVLRGSRLKEGVTTSCGCYRVGRLKKHGLSTSNEYTIWHDIRRRCKKENNINYAGYGGRGIGVCERWDNENGFMNFYDDMGKRPSKKHSIDRIDNSKGYSKENCRWTDDITQANNRRGNRVITYDNKTMTVSQWERELKMPSNNIATRLAKGWTIEDAISKPIRSINK